MARRPALTTRPTPEGQRTMIRTNFLRSAVLAGFAALPLATGFALQSTSASAETPQADAAPNIGPGAAAGYYLWHDTAGSHLRTHGRDCEHYFVARLHTDGQFVDVSAV